MPSRHLMIVASVCALPCLTALHGCMAPPEESAERASEPTLHAAQTSCTPSPNTPQVYYVATDGSDANDGTLSAPFATPAHAITQALAGDTIYVRGGTYPLADTLTLSADGERYAPIRMLAYQNEQPIFDFATHPRHANPPQPRQDDSIAGTGQAVGILTLGSWWHVEGITVRNAPYYGVRIYGSHNTFDRLTLHDNKAAGLEITGKESYSPSHNTISRSDSYHNFDPQSRGEDADGFAAKFDGLGPGNVFSQNRAWSNSDDGYDFWYAGYPIKVEECWSFDNGFNRPEWAAQISGSFQGDGIGFKLGQQSAELELDRVVAFANKGFGIDENGNGSVGGLVIRHATLVNNTKNGNPIQISLNDGSPHAVVNTVAFDVDGAGVTQFDSQVIDPSNSWNSAVSVDASDFVSTNMSLIKTQAMAARGVDGELPVIDLRLSAGSDLVDAGRSLNRPFQGTAPDLGAFEQ